ncbi:MAG: M20/M25/M40 family metallo-hydrolase [Planctomycetota bacterium]|nr:MAG: M20/M25/M40 family metallo-hydrolase [Planctomycetota bacterium]
MLAEPEPPAGALALGALLIGSFLAALFWTPPAPRTADVPEEVFSAARAAARIGELLGDGSPHPVGSSANRAVAERLLGALRALGLRPEVQERFAQSERYPTFAFVRNVLARIEGDPTARGRREALLLVAHYDSREAAPGAGDDLAGVATLLEVARALARRPRPRRDVVFLFSDGEEAGLIGASAFARYHPWFADVGAVLNLEGRGNRGPSLLFETGPESGALVARWARASTRPTGSSLLATLYERLPNDTDFTVFRRRGLRGLNFAFVGRVAHYHTALDDLAHLDRRSLQHHGEQILGLVRDLAWGPPLAAGSDLVFFDVAGRWVLSWPARWSAPLAALALALLLLCARRLVRPTRRRGVGPPTLAAGGLARGAGAVLAIGVLCSLVGGAVAAATHTLSGAQTPFVAHPLPHVLALWLSCGLAACAVGLGAVRARFDGSFLATWIAWAAAALVVALVAPGASYLLLVPALAAAFGLALLLAAGRAERAAAASALALVPFAVAAALWVPVLHALPEGMGLGPRTPLPYALAFFLTAATPLLARRSVLLPLPLLGAAAVGLLAAVFWAGWAPTATPEHPRRLNVVHLEDRPSGEAWLLLLTPGEALDEALAARLGAPFERTPRLPFPGARVLAFHAPVAPVPLPSPGLEVQTLRAAPGGRELTASLRTHRGARELALAFPPGAPLEALWLGGVRARLGRADRWRVFWCSALPPGGALELRLRLRGEEEAEVYLLDASDGDLPPRADAVRRARPPDAVSSYKGDQTIVLDRVPLP